jgi:hypothetical protein
MRVKDEREWAEFVADITSKNFVPMQVLLNAFVEWTEQLQSSGGMYYDEVLTGLPCADVLSAGDIGEMYVLALRFWPEPDSNDLFKVLTLLEKKMISENVSAKIAQSAVYAAQQGNKVV